jgi:GNAT superfamily N-acetyltransferase
MCVNSLCTRGALDMWSRGRSTAALGDADTKVPTVIPLRQRPEFCAFFAQQFESEWPKWYGPGGEGDAREDLHAFANPEGNLPVGVVAIDAVGSPIGIAALKEASIASHRHLMPWATAGYVVPSRRRAGVGAKLLSALLAEARRLSFPTVYCATASAVSLLQREGWSQIDAIVHDGDRLFVFARVVPVSGRGHR